MIAVILGVPLWRVWKREVSRSSLLTWAELPPLGAHLEFMRSRHIGHVLRQKENTLDRKALNGVFLTDRADDTEGRQTFLRSAVSDRSLDTDDKRTGSLMEDYKAHAADCTDGRIGYIEGLLK
ncbi:unnamed protein product, partial [Amoebophrya sp. A25]|eukprot:GSA25T00019182001.1